MDSEDKQINSKLLFDFDNSSIQQNRMNKSIFS
jgi:hypothetical protein